MELVLTVSPGFPPRARAWMGEVPPLPLPIGRSHLVEKRMALSDQERHSSSAAAIEVFIPSGGRFAYGLLGADYTSSKPGELLVQVAAATRGQDITEWSLARGLDLVRNGIPEWAAAEILSATFKYTGTQALGSGRLRFAFGAHGEMGSSKRIFQALSKSVITLLCMDAPVSEAQLSAIVERHFDFRSPP